MYIVKNTPFNCLVATRSILTTLTVLFSRNLTAALIFITLILSTNPIEAKIFASVSKDYDNWSNLSAKELMKRADEYLTKQNPDSAMLCFTIIDNRPSTSAHNKEELYEKTDAKISIGYMYSSYYYDFHKAFDYFSDALKMAEEIEDDTLKARCYVNLGALYSTYHQMVDDESMSDKALEMYRKAYQISRESNNYNSLLTAIYNMTAVCFSNEKFNTIQKELDDFLTIDPTGKSQRWLHIMHFIKGVKAMIDGNYSLSDINFKKSLLYKDSNSIPMRDSIVTQFAMCINQQLAGIFPQAKSDCLKILNLSQNHNFKDITAESYRLLSDICSSLGDSVGENHYKLKYVDFKDSLIASSKIKDVINLRFLNELEAKNEEVAKLSKKSDSQVTYLTITLWGLAIVAIALLIIICYNRRLKKHNLELYERLQSTANATTHILPSGSNLDMASNDSIVEEDDAGNIDTEENTEIKYKGNNLSERDKEEIMKKIMAFMETSPEIYSPEFSLEQLADILDINRSYLSQTVNELGGCNFRSLLNSYRILEARRRFEDQARYGSQTIEAIGQSVGFLSRRNFGIAFKKETGLSPSVYSRICKEKQKES